MKSENILIFLAGAIAGVGGTMIYVKKKLVPSIREELEIRMQTEATGASYYGEYYEKESSEEEEDDEAGEEDEPVISSPKHNSSVKAERPAVDYTSYAAESEVGDLKDKANDISKKPGEPVKETADKPEETEVRGSGPYVIDPAHYNMFSDFEAHEYVMYADGVIIDDETEERLDEDPELVFGETVMELLKSGKERVIFVRDENLKRDYSITLSDVPFDGPDYPDPEDDWRS